ncbi:peptidoglycan/LPS O-acetylase OafA/YrhL [Prauserella muralis]|nr:peptidoglycan/LPS O-acetylase OafA/YrhL [Prauserella muralis]
MPATTRPQSRLPTLTGMRFLAALLVFVYHAATVFVFPDRDAAADVQFVTGKLAFLGVSFFFVLSGFVLTWSSRDDDTPARFWRRRLCKIYPNHLVTFLVAVVLLVVLAKPLTGLVPNLLLVHAWWPDPAVFNSANVVSWSLSCELLFYVLFPVLHRGLARIRAARLWWWTVGVVLAVLCVPVVATAAIPATTGDPMQAGASPEQVWLVYIFPPVCLLQFVLGMLLARIVLAGRWIGVPLPVAALLLVPGYALGLVVPYTFGVNATTIVPVALIIAAAAVADERGTPTLLRSRTAVWLGEVSFAFYLVHYLVLLRGRELIGVDQQWGTAGEVALLAVAFTLSLLLAWALYAGIERPAMRRWSRPRPAEPPDPPTQPLPRQPSPLRPSVGHTYGYGGSVGVQPARPDHRPDRFPHPPGPGLPPLPPRREPVAEQPRPQKRRW